MNQEQMQITMAYHQLLTELKETYDTYMDEAGKELEHYEGIRKDDAIIWFVESLAG